MNKFYNRYNRAEDSKRVYSNVDCVDRLSYVDQTKLVKRFIAEGRSLAMFRAQSLYRDYSDAANSNDMALPVFYEDPVITDIRLKMLTDEVQNRSAERAKQSDAADSNPSVGKDIKTESNIVQSESPAIV